jgi:ABC-type multidrug transport system permease subunit
MLAVLAKEFQHMLHDPVTLVLTFGLPIVQLLLYGYALETRVHNVPAALINHDHHRAGNLLAQRIAQSPLFLLRDSLQSEQEIQAALRRGSIRVAIEIPPDYTANLMYLRKAIVRVWVDGADATTSTFLLTALDSLGLEASVEQIRVLGAASGIGLGQAPGVTIQSHVLSNPSGRTVAFLIPGLIAILVQTITALLMALSFASEREAGTLEQMLVTPLGRGAIITGKAIAIALVGFAETAFLVFLMRYLFVIPIMGSLGLFLAFVPLLVLVPLGLGLVVAAHSHNHSQAIQFANVILIPSILLSGFVFPREFLKFPFDQISSLLPSSYLVELSRDIVLRGALGADVAAKIAIIVAFAVVLLVGGFLDVRRSLGRR